MSASEWYRLNLVATPCLQRSQRNFEDVEALWGEVFGDGVGGGEADDGFGGTLGGGRGEGGGDVVNHPLHCPGARRFWGQMHG